MKTLMVAAVVMAAVMIIGSGAAQAVEKKVPETATQEYQPTLETGALPASDSVTGQKESGRTDTSVSTIELGGVTYRIGIDTQ